MSQTKDLQPAPYLSAKDMGERITGAGAPITETNYTYPALNTTAFAQSLEERVEQLESQNSLLLRLVTYLKDFFPEMGRTLSLTGASKNHRQEAETAACKNNAKAMVTKRELEVLRLIAEGFSAKEIADKLFISQTTVITHKKNLKEKLGVRNTAELVRKTAMLLR